ncbi:MAG: hypothetical protein JO322_08730 [Candidatus Eremiobacteraeota bacterium]|nr:hypothetical protein [Candidatus Eremiobacteraeota bacterium]
MEEMISPQPAFSAQTVAVAAVPAVAPSAAPVKDKQPAPDAQVASAYPTISAHLPISARASIATLQVLLDNVDVTNDASYAGQFVTYIPRNGLQKGTHTVSITGSGSDGKKFQTSWSFETTTAPEPDTGGSAAMNNSFGQAIPSPVLLNVAGNQFVGGAPISVQMTAPPGGQAFAFVCTSAFQFPMYAAPYSQFYSASIPTSTVGAAMNCPVTAMYVAPDGTVTYAPYPVFVQLLPPRSPAVQSTPQPARAPLPPPVHRTPTPVATQAPSRPHAPIIVPKVRPTPAPQ